MPPWEKDLGERCREKKTEGKKPMCTGSEFEQRRGGCNTRANCRLEVGGIKNGERNSNRHINLGEAKAKSRRKKNVVKKKGPGRGGREERTILDRRYPSHGRWKGGKRFKKDIRKV